MRLEIRGIPFDNVTMDEALDAAMRLLSQPGASYGVTPNSEIVYETLHDDALRFEPIHRVVFGVCPEQLLEELEQLRPRVGFEIANYHTYVAVIKQKYTPANPRATDSSVAKDNIVALSTVMEKEPLALDQHQAKLLMQLESIFLQLPDQIDLEAIRKSLKIFKRPQSIKAGYIKNTPETQTDTISFIQYKIN